LPAIARKIAPTQSQILGASQLCPCFSQALIPQPLLPGGERGLEVPLPMGEGFRVRAAKVGMLPVSYLALCRFSSPNPTPRPTSMPESSYLDIFLAPIRKCADYTPKFGVSSREEGLNLAGFKNLYGGDPFYSWIGLDSDLMYAAHKAAGGMTSIYRQIGSAANASSAKSCLIAPDTLHGTARPGRTPRKPHQGRQRRSRLTDASDSMTFASQQCTNALSNG